MWVCSVSEIRKESCVMQMHCRYPSLGEEIMFQEYYREINRRLSPKLYQRDFKVILL